MTDLLLPGGKGAELACFGDAAALAGGDVLLPLDRRPVDHEVLLVVAGSHGRGAGDAEWEALARW
jgi:hypothetical protein